jgi:hypothetical protein
MIFDTDAIKEKYLNVVKQAWLTTESTFPAFLCEISKERKLKNETYINSTRIRLQESMNHMPKVPWRKKHWKHTLLTLVEEVLYQENIINIHSSMEPKELAIFQDELKEFMRQVRKFSPELSFEEIGQALRNYIVYAMFKKIHMDNSGFSRAGFGYSMLYPFTDNFIDNRNTTPAEKVEYNQIIRNKLEGNKVFPSTTHHKKTCALLEDIETVFPRKTHPMTSRLLLMMLDAQESSLQQQDSTSKLTMEDRLDISIYKGGISVLIDRYFVSKELTEADILFYIGLGFFLQLADDLQDIKEDSENGYQTLFTFNLDPVYEETLVNQLLHFIYHIMDSFQAENNHFKEFVLLNCYQLIYTSIIRSKAFFTPEYLERIERLLPVTICYYDNFKKDMALSFEDKDHNKYHKILDALIFA